MLVTEMIARGALHHRDRIALRFGTKEMRFGEVDAFSNRLANALISGLGLDPLWRSREGEGSACGRWRHE